MIYLVLYLFLSVLALSNMGTKQIAQKKLFLLFSILLLILLSGLRYETGTDWEPFYEYFHAQLDVGEHYFEVGYQLLTYIVNNITGNYNVFLLVNASFLMLVYFSIKNYSNPNLYMLTVLVFYSTTYLVFLGGNRQAIALAIVIYSIKYLISREFIKFLSAVFLASLFHLSAWIFLPVYFIANRTFSNAKLLVFFTVAALSAQMFDIKNMLLVVVHYSGMAGWWQLVTLDPLDPAIDYTFRNTVLILENLTLLSALLIFRKQLLDRVPHFNVHLNITLAGYVFFLVFFEAARNLAGRGALLFRFSECILIANLINITTDRNLKIMIYMLLVAYFGIRVAYTLIFSVDYYVPYKTVLYQ